jgi:hypothetical protein
MDHSETKTPYLTVTRDIEIREAVLGWARIGWPDIVDHLPDIYEDRETFSLLMMAFNAGRDYEAR